MRELNPIVDQFIQSEKKWRDEFVLLRSLVHHEDLIEEIKWGVPCYTYHDKNVVLIHGFKEYCALLFIKGSLLSDPLKLLIQQTQNVQAGRQLRFTSIDEILQHKESIINYVKEAIILEKSGAKVEFKPTENMVYPDELLQKFEVVPQLKVAFLALTPGRQRAYILHFTEPKQAKTREARIEKYYPKILDGKGLFD